MIRKHFSPIVKHVLAPQNDFGMQKITWSNYKESGIWVDPTPPVFFFSKFPHFPICFGECPFNMHSCDKTSKIHLWSSGHLMLDLGLEEYILEYLECGGRVRKRRIRHFRCHFPQFERAAVV